MSPRRNWESPDPSLASECAPPPGTKEREHSRVRGWGSPNSDDWRKALCLLCATLQLEERDSDARDVSGVKTPLFLAIRAKHLPAIRLLIGTHLSIHSKYYV
jgi:hypothetical protein